MDLNLSCAKDFQNLSSIRLPKILGSNSFSAWFTKIISHFKKIGYNINVLQQTACLGVNPITVACWKVVRTSDTMTVPT